MDIGIEEFQKFVNEEPKERPEAVQGWPKATLNHFKDIIEDHDQQSHALHIVEKLLQKNGETQFK